MSASLKKSLKITLPVLMGYLPAGIAFGVLAAAQGIPWYYCVFMSLVTYSGAAQYAAIPLVATGQSITSVGVNTLGINLRHVFYALPLLDQLPKNRFKKNFCLFALTDECFSVMTTVRPEEREALFFPAAFLMYFYWVASGALGVMLSGVLIELVPNLDFALPCLFVVLWFEQVRQNKLVWPSLLALAAFVITHIVIPEYALLMALGFCVVGILLVEIFSKKDTSYRTLS